MLSRRLGFVHQVMAYLFDKRLTEMLGYQLGYHRDDARDSFGLGRVTCFVQVLCKQGHCIFRDTFYVLRMSNGQLNQFIKRYAHVEQPDARFQHRESIGSEPVVGRRQWPNEPSVDCEADDFLIEIGLGYEFVERE